MAGQVINPQIPIVDKGGVMSLPFYKYLLGLQAGTGNSGAPVNAEYVVLTGDPTLTQERVLTAGANITITDGGPGAAVTIAALSSSAIADDALTLAWLGL